MKDYKLSEIKKICEESKCERCPIENECGLIKLTPQEWDIDSNKEKIKTFVMWLDLEYQASQDKLNATGLSALMRLREICKDWKGQEIIELINNLGE